jgi:hypothetical protein
MPSKIDGCFVTGRKFGRESGRDLSGLDRFKKVIKLRNKAFSLNFHAGNSGSSPGGDVNYVGELRVILKFIFL